MESPCALREHHEVRQAIGDEPLSVAQKYLYEVVQERRCTSAGSTLGPSAGRVRPRDSNTRRAIDLLSHVGCDELLRNKESCALTVELDATLCQVQEAEASRCPRQHRPSPRIGCWSSARHTKSFDELGAVRRLSRRIWTNAGTTGPLGVNPVQAKNPGQTTERDRCRRLRRLKKQGVGTEAPISRNGTTTLGESLSGLWADC